MTEHGGDVYRNKVNIDLSVNISPYGVPPMVRAAIHSAVLDVEKYPDPLYEELREAIAKSEGVSSDKIVCGNGASELIYAVARTVIKIVNAKKQAAILVPCYSEYKESLVSAGIELVNQVCLDEKKDFLPDEESIRLLFGENHNKDNRDKDDQINECFVQENKTKENMQSKPSVIMLGNPNNPTGRVLPKEWLCKLINRAEAEGIFVVLDESFLPLTEHEDDYKDIHSKYLIRIKAYTKSMAIPGVRLGYLISENENVIREIKQLLPDWNVSGIAAVAGVAAAQAKEWLRARVFDKENGIKALTKFLSEKLIEKGFTVFDTDTNYLLIKYEDELGGKQSDGESDYLNEKQNGWSSDDTKGYLYEEALKKGILIRDCSNFEGLGHNFYRIAVKGKSESQSLLEVIEHITEESELEADTIVNSKTQLLSVEPKEIEKTSFEILTKELEAKGIYLDGDTASVIKRCIHTTADFEYASTLTFSDNAIQIAKNLIREGACIVTDTNMALSGINKTELAKYGGQVHCFMADPEIARVAKERGSTRASVSMEHAALLGKKIIFAIGNAPTALVTLCEMMDEGKFTPDFVIGVPVGFVNVEQAKEMIIDRKINHIVNRGRKGGSNVAAAIMNAILYSMRDEAGLKD